MSNRPRYKTVCSALLVLSLGLFSQMPFVHAGPLSSTDQGDAGVVADHCGEHVSSDRHYGADSGNSDHHGASNSSDAGHCIQTIIETGPSVSHPSPKDLVATVDAILVWKIEIPFPLRYAPSWQGGSSPPENRKAAFAKENRRRL